MNKFKAWLGKFKKPELKPIDTTPDQFNEWLSQQVGKKLRGGGTYYTIGIVGQISIPTAGNNFLLYGDRREADEKLSELRYGNRGTKLEVRVIKMFYSIQ